MGEETCGVPVITHSQEHDVQSAIAELFLEDQTVFLGRVLRRDFSAHAINVVAGDGNLGEKSAMRHAKIALGRIRRNTALVAEEDFNLRPVDLLPVRTLAKKIVKCFRRMSPSQSDGKKILLCDASFSSQQDLIGGCTRNMRHIGYYLNLSVHSCGK